MVKGTWWAAAGLQPVILSIGAVLSAINLDVLDVQPIEWRKLLTFKNDKDENTPDTKEVEQN